MGFRNFFKGKDFKKQEIQLEEQVIEEPKEIVEINAEGFFKIKIIEPNDNYANDYLNYTWNHFRISCNVGVDLGNAFDLKRISSFLDIYPEKRMTIEELYDYILEYLGGEQLEKDLRVCILRELNKMVSKDKEKQVKELLDKEFNLNISIKAEKNEKGYFI